MSSWLHGLLGLHGWPAYLLVGALCFGEAAVFLGFVIPGETAVVLGGVLASQHHVSLPGIIAVVIVCAIVGDTVGYEVGRHFGPSLMRRGPLKDSKGVEKATAYLEQKGGPAVFLGRWTALFRAVMPGAAGLSRLRYRTFLFYNALGGIAWGLTFTLAGYFAGKSYERVVSIAGKASTGILVAVVLGISGFLVWRRVRERRQLSAEGPAHGPSADGDGAQAGGAKDETTDVAGAAAGPTVRATSAPAQDPAGGGPAGAASDPEGSRASDAAPDRDGTRASNPAGDAGGDPARDLGTNTAHDPAHDPDGVPPRDRAVDAATDATRNRSVDPPAAGTQGTQGTQARPVASSSNPD